MGYGNQDLEEIPFTELQAEIARRQAAMSNGVCIYCHASLENHTCKYSVAPERYLALIPCPSLAVYAVFHDGGTCAYATLIRDQAEIFVKARGKGFSHTALLSHDVHITKIPLNVVNVVRGSAKDGLDYHQDICEKE